MLSFFKPIYTVEFYLSSGQILKTKCYNISITKNKEGKVTSYEIKRAANNHDRLMALDLNQVVAIKIA